MNLQFFFFIFNTIICSGYVFKKLDYKFLDLKILDLEKEVCISITSKDYLMLNGYLYDEETCFFKDQFEIYGIKMHNYIKIKIRSKYSLDLFMNNLVDRVFVLKAKKRILNLKNNFECKFKIFKKEDIRGIMTNYLSKISLINEDEEDDITEAFYDLYEELQQYGITYGIRFNKNNGKIVDYELGVYKNAEEVERESPMSFIEGKKSFKSPMVAIAKHTLVSVTLFGPFGLILVYLIGKYLIKR